MVAGLESRAQCALAAASRSARPYTSCEAPEPTSGINWPADRRTASHRARLVTPRQTTSAACHASVTIWVPEGFAFGQGSGRDAAGRDSHPPSHREPRDPGTPEGGGRGAGWGQASEPSGSGHKDSRRCLARARGVSSLEWGEDRGRGLLACWPRVLNPNRTQSFVPGGWLHGWLAG